MNELSERIKAAREFRGLSQRALCLKAELSLAYICQLESDRIGKGSIKQPAIHTLNKLAGALGCTPQWIAFGIGAGPRGLKTARRKKPIGKTVTIVDRRARGGAYDSRIKTTCITQRTSESK